MIVPFWNTDSAGRGRERKGGQEKEEQRGGERRIEEKWILFGSLWDIKMRYPANDIVLLFIWYTFIVCCSRHWEYKGEATEALP